MQYLGRLSGLMGSLLLTGLMEKIVKSCVPAKLGNDRVLRPLLH